jgi:hypothetical protein
LLGDLIKAAGDQQKLEGIRGMPLAPPPCANPASSGVAAHENAATAHVRPALLDPELLRQPPLAHLVPARD